MVSLNDVESMKKSVGGAGFDEDVVEQEEVERDAKRWHAHAAAVKAAAAAKKAAASSSNKKSGGVDAALPTKAAAEKEDDDAASSSKVGRGLRAWLARVRKRR